MALNFDSEPLTIRCPYCGNHFEETISRLKYYPKLACPSCDRYVGVNLLELHSALESSRKSMDKLFEKLLKSDNETQYHPLRSLPRVERRRVRRFQQGPAPGAPDAGEGT